MCPDCGKPVAECVCGPLRALGRKLGDAPAATAAPDQTRSSSGKPSGDKVRVSRDRGGRGGKTVTVVTGLTGSLQEMEDFSRTLRKAMGSGGTLKDGRIEVQGDHVDRVLEWLNTQGIKAKRSGG